MMNAELDFLYALVFSRDFRNMLSQFLRVGHEFPASLVPGGLLLKHVDFDEVGRFSQLIQTRLLKGQSLEGKGIEASFPLTLDLLSVHGRPSQDLMERFISSESFRQVVEVEPFGEGISLAEAFLSFALEECEGAEIGHQQTLIPLHEFLVTLMKILTITKNPLFQIRHPKVHSIGSNRFAFLEMPWSLWEKVSGNSPRSPHLKQTDPVLILYFGGTKFIHGIVPREAQAVLRTASILSAVDPGERGNLLQRIHPDNPWVGKWASLGAV